MEEKTLIRIVDDDASLCDALKFMLRSEGWNAAVYTSASDFLDSDLPTTPGCIVLDYQMPEINGVELQDMLIRRGYTQPILFLTAHADVDMAINVFKKGANDLLKKPVQAKDFLKAIALAVERDAQSRTQVVDAGKEKELFMQLTAREAEVLNLVALGLMNYQIADRLNLSERTVEAHRASGYRRLGIKTVAELSLMLNRLQDIHETY